MSAKMVELWIGDPPGTVQAISPIGTGFRRLLYIENVGRKNVKLFSASYLCNLVVPVEQFNRAQPVEFDCRVVKRIIKDNIEAERRRSKAKKEKDEGEGNKKVSHGARSIAAGRQALNVLRAGAGAGA